MRWMVVGLAMLAGACAFPRDVQHMSVDLNSAVASSSDELTLTNVLRAKRFQPLHFTSLSALRGSISINGAGSLTVPVATGATSYARSAAGVITGSSRVDPNVGVTPYVTGGFSSGPNFDIGVFDTQEFEQGVTAALPETTVSNFLYQGWRDDLVSFLLVRRVNIVLAEAVDQPWGKLPRGTLLDSIENTPDDPQDAGRFGGFVRCFEMEPQDSEDDVRELVPLGALSSITMADLATMDTHALQIAPASGTNTPARERMLQRLVASTQHLHLLKRDDDLPSCAALHFANGTARAPDPHHADAGQHIPVPLGNESYLLSDLDAATLAGFGIVKATMPAHAAVAVRIEVVFRSVQGVFEGLGSYLRAQDKAATDPKYAASLYQVGDPARRYFVLERDPRTPAMAATLSGERWGVPDTPDARETQTTLQIVGLLQALVNLQKKSGDKPSTQAVQVVR